MTHTKTPWTANGQQIRDQSEFGVSIAYCGEVYGAGIGKGGKVRSYSIDADTAKANAAFIVHAVNNHQALVMALLRLDTLLDFGDDDLDHVWEFEDLTAIQAAFSEAKAALAAALPAPPVEQAKTEVEG